MMENYHTRYRTGEKPEVKISDLIERFELLHDELTYERTLYFPFHHIIEAALYLVHNIFNLVHRNGSLLASLHDAVKYFVAVKCFTAAVLLDYHDYGGLDLFVRRKALAALLTFAASSDCAPLLYRSVLFAHFAKDVSTSDRFYSNINMYNEIEDAFVRHFTKVLSEAKIPIQK